MSCLRKILECLPKCLKSTESTNELLSYFDAAFHGVFEQLDKTNPLHYWSIDDFHSVSPALMTDGKLCIDGTVNWIKGGMDLKAFRAKVQAMHRSLYYRFEFLKSPLPTEKEIGKRLVIVGSHNRTRITLYDHGPGLE